jgi:hypothetical protein
MSEFLTTKIEVVSMDDKQLSFNNYNEALIYELLTGYTYEVARKFAEKRRTKGLKDSEEQDDLKALYSFILEQEREIKISFEQNLNKQLDVWWQQRKYWGDWK